MLIYIILYSMLLPMAFFIHKATIAYLPFYWLLHCRLRLFYK